MTEVIKQVMLNAHFLPMMSTMIPKPSAPVLAVSKRARLGGGPAAGRPSKCRGTHARPTLARVKIRPVRLFGMPISWLKMSAESLNMAADSETTRPPWGPFHWFTELS